MKQFVVIAAIVTLMGCNSAPTAPSKGQPNNTAPVISLFAADSTKLTLVQTTNLHWEVLDQTAEIRIDPYPGNVPALGSASVVPVTTGVISFTLTARNQFGTTQRFVTITVQ